MKNIQKELSLAIAGLERLSMSGKALDVMAEAKRHIYVAQGIAKKYDEEMEAAELEAKEEKGDG